VPFVSGLRQICSLYLLNNPCIRLISGLRRDLVLHSPTLHYLDDRPITELERKRILAYEEGGKEAEDAVREEANKEYRDKLRCGYDRNRQLEEESRIERKKQFKRMLADVKTTKGELASKLEDILGELKDLDPESVEYRRLWEQKYKLEREVRHDWYH